MDSDGSFMDSDLSVPPSPSASSMESIPVYRVRSLEHPRPAPSNIANHQSGCSLPNIKIGPFTAAQPQRLSAGYADEYMASYSDLGNDSSDEENEILDDSKPYLPQYSPPRNTAAVVGGAARLSKMVYGHRRPQPNIDAGPVVGNRRARAGHVRQEDASSKADDHPKTRESKPEGGNRINSKHASHQDIRLTDLIDHMSPAVKSATVDENTATSSISTDTIAQACSRSAEQEAGIMLKPYTLPENDEEYNGLIAPGAFADEKQKAKADANNKLVTRIFAMDRKEREMKQFKPIIFDPVNHQHNGNIESRVFDEDDYEGRFSSKFPFCCCCCCPARYCVGIAFMLIIVLFIAGFFAWPRIPSISINNLVALSRARIIYDTDSNLYGLQMPIKINYEINSGNFYPLRIQSIHVLGFDGVTGNKIINAHFGDINVPGQNIKFASQSTVLSYLTSDMMDPALADLFGPEIRVSIH
ncbi:hypothetical protein GGI12_001220 [Dipsacomyces acuminosporus]|nr:hypothetical protein GGI12_001220 [Dipsacomyces acuminosporus]